MQKSQINKQEPSKLTPGMVNPPWTPINKLMSTNSVPFGRRPSPELGEPELFPEAVDDRSDTLSNDPDLSSGSSNNDNPTQDASFTSKAKAWNDNRRISTRCKSSPSESQVVSPVDVIQAQAMEITWRKPKNIAYDHLNKADIAGMLNITEDDLQNIRCRFINMLQTEEKFRTWTGSSSTVKLKNELCEIATRYIPWENETIMGGLNIPCPRRAKGWVLWKYILLLRKEIPNPSESSTAPDGDMEQLPGDQERRENGQRSSNTGSLFGNLRAIANAAGNSVLGHRNSQITDEERGTTTGREDFDYPDIGASPGPRTLHSLNPYRRTLNDNSAQAISTHERFESPNMFRPAGPRSQIHQDSGRFVTNMGQRHQSHLTALQSPQRYQNVFPSDARFLSQTPSSIQSPGCLSPDRHISGTNFGETCCVGAPQSHCHCQHSTPSRSGTYGPSNQMQNNFSNQTQLDDYREQFQSLYQQLEPGIATNSQSRLTPVLNGGEGNPQISSQARSVAPMRAQGRTLLGHSTAFQPPRDELHTPLRHRVADANQLQVHPHMEEGEAFQAGGQTSYNAEVHSHNTNIWKFVSIGLLILLFFLLIGFICWAYDLKIVRGLNGI